MSVLWLQMAAMIMENPDFASPSSGAELLELHTEEKQLSEEKTFMEEVNKETNLRELHHLLCSLANLLSVCYGFRWQQWSLTTHHHLLELNYWSFTPMVSTTPLHSNRVCPISIRYSQYSCVYLDIFGFLLDRCNSLLWPKTLVIIIEWCTRLCRYM